MVLKPLPGLPVIYKRWLGNDDPRPERERLESQDATNPRARTSAACVPIARWSARVIGWDADKCGGPAGLLHAYRFLSRDHAIGERLDNLEDLYRLFRCRSILNCADVCTKGVLLAAAINKMKDRIVRRGI